MIRDLTQVDKHARHARQLFMASRLLASSVIHSLLQKADQRGGQRLSVRPFVHNLLSDASCSRSNSHSIVRNVSSWIAPSWWRRIASFRAALIPLSTAE